MATLRRLVAKQTHGPELGFLGSSYVNVLQLNQALSRLRPASRERLLVHRPGHLERG